MIARARNVRIPSILGGAVVPEWPDFGVERMSEPGGNAGFTVWRASTDTHRPGTPVFSVCITDHVGFTDEEAREALGERLRTVYAKAHPDGCPGTHS